VDGTGNVTGALVMKGMTLVTTPVSLGVFFYVLFCFFAGGGVACRSPELLEELCVSTTSEGGRSELLVSSPKRVFFYIVWIILLYVNG